MTFLEPDNRNIPLVPDSLPRASLTVTSGPGAGQTIRCRRFVTLVGRREGCKLTLRHRSVSPLHLAVIHTGSAVVLRDLCSTSGTLLNGLNLEQDAADDGDVITIGPWEIRVDVTPPPAGVAPPLHLDPVPHVLLLEHMSTRRLFRPTREVCLIGRRPGCDIVISDSRISRAHAVVFRILDRPVIADLRSARHLHVNGNERAFSPLVDGDEITIGKTRFRLRLPSPLAVGDRPTSTEPEAPAPGGGNGTAKSEVEASDLVDIRAAESSRKWRIVDHLKRAERKQ